MKAILVITLLVVLVSAIAAVQPTDPAAPAESDLGLVEDIPIITTRIPRRRLNGNRLKSKTESDHLSDIATTTTTIAATEKSSKHSRTTSSGSSVTSGTVITPQLEVTTVQPMVSVTYRRPKFPPRRLPTRRTTTVAPHVESTTETLYPDGPEAEGALEEDLPAQNPVEDPAAAASP